MIIVSKTTIAEWTDHPGYSFQVCWSSPTFQLVLIIPLPKASCPTLGDLEHPQEEQFSLLHMERHCQPQLQIIWWLGHIAKCECYFCTYNPFSTLYLLISGFSHCHLLYNEQESLNLELEGTIKYLLGWTSLYSYGNRCKVTTPKALCCLDTELMLIVKIILFTFCQSFRTPQYLCLLQTIHGNYSGCLTINLETLLFQIKFSKIKCWYIWYLAMDNEEIFKDHY